MKPIRTTLVLVLSLAALSGCGKSESTMPDAAPATSAQEEAQPQATAARSAPKACDLITADEMTAMVGEPVQGTPDEGGGRTGCVWQPASGGMPYVELKIEWGGGEAAMMASGFLGKVEPGINSAFDDLGDEAVQNGAGVWIKRGDDLVTITPVGTENSESLVRKIYEMATARL